MHFSKQFTGLILRQKEKGIANPIASILSTAMLLDLKLDVAANKLRKEAVEHALDHRYVTEGS